ncbi:MAG TPA: hypothetical protein VGN63_02990 [Flavisolibacter sp.]|jgi:hypothetical protein|nr:hypothetical protein [Flavisolibacter sp.]
MNDLLAKLGFKESTRISDIQFREKIELRSEHKLTGQSFYTVYTGIRMIQYAIEKLQQEDYEQPDVENLYLKGHHYAAKNINPTIQTVWEEIVANPLNKAFINKVRKQFKRAVINQQRCPTLIADIVSMFKKVAYGGLLAEQTKQVEKAVRVVASEKAYFQEKYAQVVVGEEFSKEVEQFDILLALNYKLTDTISEIEQRENLIHKMAMEFKAINSPDLRRTIKDRIDAIKAKLKPPEHSIFPKNFYAVGDLMAIRGENPKIIDLIKEYNGEIFFRSSWDSAGFTNNPIKNAALVVGMILEGYALSYHLIFLQKQLESSQSQAPTHVQLLPIKLKWKGQKNQLYDVLRILKGKGMLLNSYEDLAAFLKQHVDIFAETNLSTILKEIGKDKRPPKGRRIEID